MTVEHADAAIRNRPANTPRFGRSVNTKHCVPIPLIEIERSRAQRVTRATGNTIRKAGIFSRLPTDHVFRGRPSRPFCLPPDASRTTKGASCSPNANAVSSRASARQNEVQIMTTCIDHDCSRRITTERHDAGLVFWVKLEMPPFATGRAGNIGWCKREGRHCSN